MKFLIGDLVTRVSYQHDIIFRVSAHQDDTVILHGEDIRLKADAPAHDLVPIEQRELDKRRKKEKEKEETSYRLFRQDYQLMKEKREYQSTEGFIYPAQYFQIPAKVLHLDGDKIYLKKCVELYQRMGLHVHGVHVHEKDMPFEISGLIEKIRPDIMVITGHDAFLQNKGVKSELQAYRNSRYFVETVRAARDIVPQLDQLAIFAGACQSHFESLIRAGANFASSPFRVNIHALDPVYIAAKIAYTPFMEKIGIWEVLRNTLTGEKGMGGVETKGLLRTGYPYIEDVESFEN